MSTQSDLSLLRIALLALVGVVMSMLACAVFGLTLALLVSAFECGWEVVRA